MLNIRPRIADALARGQPIVALESTLITHGLPWPVNVETARAAEDAGRGHGAVPATIGLLSGEPIIGLSNDEIERLARSDAAKASRRDLAAVMTQRRSASTTVAATIFLAQRAGITIFATGGVGGVHRGAEHSFDISSD